MSGDTFEKWAESMKFVTLKDRGEYRHPGVQLAFVAWQECDKTRRAKLGNQRRELRRLNRMINLQMNGFKARILSETIARQNVEIGNLRERLYNITALGV